MFAHNGIIFFDFHFFRHGAFVLVCCIEMPCACGRDQSNFFSHDAFSLDLFAAFANIGNDVFDAAFINNAHAFGREAQAYPAVFAFDPETMGMKIRQKTPFGFVVGMGYIVSRHWSFSSHLTYPGHCCSLQNEKTLNRTALYIKNVPS